ncbi:hypothetical protein HDE_12110 [Halotydeus destructor]|nr:hypothetical protein HDE_12110 [Halotydeus destructor]
MNLFQQSWYCFKPQFTTIWFAICGLGFAYHAYVVTETYMENHNASATETIYLAEITPPAISFCFRIGDIYDESKHHYGNSDSDNDIIKECQKAKAGLLENKFEQHGSCMGTIVDYDDEIIKGLKRFVHTFSELVNKVSVVNSSNFDFDEMSGTSLKRFEAHSVQIAPLQNLICYRVVLNHGLKQSYERSHPKFSSLLKPFFAIEFNRSKVENLSHIEVFLHRANTLPQIYDQSAMLKSTSTYQFGYRQHETRYKTGFFSQPCKVYHGYDQITALMDCIKTDTECVDQRLNKFEMCYKQIARSDCFSQMYEPVVMKKEDGCDNTLRMELILETKTIRTTVTPKISQGEYVALLTGVLGFWLGFNLVSGLEFSYRAIKSRQGKLSHPVVELK